MAEVCRAEHQLNEKHLGVFSSADAVLEKAVH